MADSPDLPHDPALDALAPTAQPITPEPTPAIPAAPATPAPAEEVAPWRQRQQQAPLTQPQQPQQEAVAPWRQRQAQQEELKTATTPESPGWLTQQNLLETAKTAGQLSTLPGLAKAGYDYWTGKKNQTAAVYSGMQEMAAGNLPDTLFELGRGGLHQLLGTGKTSQQQAQADDEYKAQLQAQHPAATWSGRILGLFGLGAGAELGTAAAATKIPQIANTFAGKVAWSSLIGAGQGALTGFGGSRDWNERVAGAKNGAILGGFLGGIGGAAGHGLDTLAGKGAGSEAAEHLGLEAHVPLANQTEEYGHALQKVIPASDMSGQDVGRSIQDKALDLLKAAGTKDAALSADGVRTVAVDLAHTLRAQNIDIHSHLGYMSPSAQKAWSAVEELAMEAATNPTGKVNLGQVATYGKLINSFYKDSDTFYQAIRSSYNKFMDNALNSTMFSGDASAVQDYARFKQLYAAGAQLSSKSALGKILDYHHSANEVANWVTNASKVGQMNQGVDLLQSISNLVGPASPEWRALQSLMFRNIAAPSGGPGPKLAQTLSNFVQTPIAKTLYTDPQRQAMMQLSQGLGALPKNALHAAARGHGAEGVAGGVGMIEGFKEGWEHGAGEEWTDRMWHAVLGAGAGGLLGGVGGHGLTHIPHLLARIGAQPGAAAAARFGVPFAANKAIVPNMGWPYSGVAGQPTAEQPRNKSYGGEVPSQQHNAHQQSFHGSSPSVDRAVRLARSAMQEGGTAPGQDAPDLTPPEQDQQAVPEPGTPPNRLPPRFGTGEASPAFQKVVSGLGQQMIDPLQQSVESTKSVPLANPNVMTEEDAFRQNQQWNKTGQAVPALATQVAAANAPFMRADPNTLGIFGGKLSKTADLPALKMAQDMAATGAERADIWDKTGWFQGADQQWRYEIPDNKLRAIEGMGRAHGQLPHPELYKAYPNLKAGIADVNTVPQESGATSWAKPVRSLLTGEKFEKPFFEIFGPDNQTHRSVAAHELQHGVQRLEGFAPGSGMPMEAEAFKSEPRYNELQARAREVRKNPHAEPLSIVEQSDMQAYNQRAFENYRKSAGEVEARNVQTRLSYPPNLRRAVPPWETEDTPPHQQNVRSQEWLDSFLNRQHQILSPEDQALIEASKTQREAEARAIAKAREGQKGEAFKPEEPPKIESRSKPSDIFSPAVRNPNTPMFDYSRLSEVPNRPQFNLPRTGATELPPALKNALTNPRTVDAYARAGMKIPGGLSWYNNEPLRERFVGELGQKEGNARFSRSMDYQAAASPLNTVRSQIPTGSYLYHANEQGIPLPNVIPGRVPGKRMLDQPMPTGYGNPAQANHIIAANNISAGRMDLNGPKMQSYSQNLQGNYQPLTIDRHNWRMWGGQGDVPPRRLYGPMESMQQGRAARMGLEPAQYQSTTWLGARDVTGVKTGNDPFLKMFEDQLREKANSLGLPPETVLRNYIRGVQPLRSGGRASKALAIARRRGI